MPAFFMASADSCDSPFGSAPQPCFAPCPKWSRTRAIGLTRPAKDQILDGRGAQRLPAIALTLNISREQLVTDCG
jgi:hypothetical protein